MATPQLATFKAPTVDNEPMVSAENLLSLSVYRANVYRNIMRRAAKSAAL